MIGVSRRWASSSWVDGARAARSLGLFAGCSSEFEEAGASSFFKQVSPRSKPTRSWRATRSQSGLTVLLYGWIDNPKDLAAALGLRTLDPELLYVAAFERWGDRVDARINGLYSAIIALPDGRLRLARSAPGGFPLFYAANSEAAIVCSIPRPIFAAGWPQRLREDMFLSHLGFQVQETQEETQYHDLWQVPASAIVYLSPDGPQTIHWYDVAALPDTRYLRDNDYVEAAQVLLADSVRNALASSSKPAVSLSGGLDSPIATVEVLRQLPVDQRLLTFTFCPVSGWSGKEPPTCFADERGHVSAFAKMHPQIDAHFVDNAGIGFDDKAEELFLACSTAYPVGVIGTPHHGISRAAVDHGVDWLFTAGDGNVTYSFTPPWIYSKFLLRGRWIELWKLAATRAGDPRGVLRRIASHALMPVLPMPLANLVRRLVHPKGYDMLPRNPLLKADLKLPNGPSIAGGYSALGRRSWLRKNSQFFGMAGELIHGYEQVFGIRYRDLTHYRPLIEFCFSIPDEQYVHNGMDRWLARRMAAGSLPEAQRLERRNGLHGADWHYKLSPRLDELRSMIDRMEGQELVAPNIDFSVARDFIDNWPMEDPGIGGIGDHLRFSLPATILMSRFADYVEGRN